MGGLRDGVRGWVRGVLRGGVSWSGWLEWLAGVV